MRNFSDYINLPFKHQGRDRLGADCNGLIHLIYFEQRGIVLPDYLEVDYSEKWVFEGCNYIEDIRRETVNNKVWRIVEAPYEIFDVLVFYASPRKIVANHIGLFIGEDNKFIHISSSYKSKIDRLEGIWKKRLYGAVRYNLNRGG